MNLEMLDSYELIENRNVKELYSDGYLLRHKKTGARVFVLENDDNNKVFCIGFRTPPADSTGVPHIMEHSVLCGSKKFPAKDPFVELVKGSLNTFLNAMTYPDKTVYPVASTNDKDFKNLMHVYMDAVLNPNIYIRPEIFMQEGWHYEMESADGELTINGVVYNEMKGAFSSPDDMIDRHTYEALYPDTAYAKESGGDPECIPQLTYDEFLDFHRKYYHPSNSYIYLYGNLDMNERLDWLDKEYLGNYNAIDIDSSLKLQEPFEEMVRLNVPYSITEDESPEDNTYLSYSCVIDTALNKELYMAFQIIEYALLSAPGAPLKEKLIKSGIGQDVISTYENGIYQPYFSITVKNANESDEERFLSVIREELTDICTNGIDKKALFAGINFYEFKYRESDFGSFPKGLIYGLQSFDSWLYDEKDPFMHISANDTIDFLKKQAEGDYFETLIRKYLIDNKHSAIIISAPVKGLTSIKDEELKNRLADYKKTLTKAEIEHICNNTAALKKYQEEPSTKEELLSIPLLEISDIDKKIEKVSNKEIVSDGVKYLFHDVKSNGISYLTLLFDLKSLPNEYLPYLGIYKSFLGMLSTENYSYTDLMNEINCTIGGVSFSTAGYNIFKSEKSYIKSFEAEAKFLKGQSPFSFKMLKEILYTSDFCDKERIHELLLMIKSRMQSSMIHAGHSIAVSRAMTYFSQKACYNDLVSGYGFYSFVNDLLEDFDNSFAEFTAKIKECMSYIFCKENLLIDFTGSCEDFDAMKSAAKEFYDSLSDKKYPENTELFEMSNKREGFKTSSQVQYVALAGNYMNKNLPYTGALRVLKVIMGYDYLWINVRVKGGAYGCMNGFSNTGDSYFVSYRDPNLTETIEIYKRAAAYIEAFDADERDMTKFIIGTISDLDTPLTPKMKGNMGLAVYLTGFDDEERQKERDEILAADITKIRELSKYISAIVDDNNLCVVGKEDKIKENEKLFKTVINLL